jgi:hypothetical protein
MLVPILAALFFGCSTGPVFTEVTEMNVRHISSNGLVERSFSARDLTKISECLYQTNEIGVEKASPKILPTTYLIEVKDKAGVRSFELYTQTNLKGNKGQYYENNCLFQFIRG